MLSFNLNNKQLLSIKLIYSTLNINILIKTIHIINYKVYNLINRYERRMRWLTHYLQIVRFVHKR